MEIKNSYYKFKILGPEHNAEMLEILKENPIESNGLALCFDREPDIFKMAQLKYDPVKYIGFFKNEKLLGFGLIGYFNAYVNGKPEQVFHFTDLYVKESGRYKGFYYRASPLFFGESYEKKCWGYSIIMHGNVNAEGYISRQHKNFPLIPPSRILATLDVRNVIITFKKKEDKRYKILVY